MKIKKLSIKTIREGYHPRKNFRKKEELKGSIEKEGLLEPLLVRRDGEKYIVIDGVMRLRVVKDLDWKEVDCIIIDADEEKSYHLAYIKNTERKNLNHIEVALHLQTVKEKFGYNNEDLVRQGYAPHRSTLDNKISLLSLPDDIQQEIVNGNISPTVGYRLANLEDVQDQSKIAQDVINNGGMSVKKVENKIKSLIDSRRNQEKETQIRIPEGNIPGVFFKDASDMSELKDESVGLIVTSPPYWVGMEYEEGVSFEEHLEMLRNVLSECARVLVPGGTICINFVDIHTFGSRNGGKPETKLMGHEYQKILGKHGIRLVDEIVWEKPPNWKNNPQCGYNEKSKQTDWRILRNTEKIYIFRKNGNRTVPYHIEFESRISKDEWKEWVNAIWKISPVRKQEGHPAAFPEEFPKRLIKMYSYKRDLVVDCFGGTMTTVKVANELGRIGIGYEKEEKYKTVIMEKLGLTEKDLKKPEVDEDGGTHGGNSHFINEFEGVITDILAEKNQTTKDIVSVRVPHKSGFSKDEIEIDWVTDDEEPDPSGPTASPQFLKTDDYEKENILRKVA